MRCFRFLLLSLLVGSSSAYAAAFQLYELGTPIIATAGVGQAVVNDASAAYFNPAGMGFLPATQFMLGSQLILPYANFSRNTANTIKGDNGGNAGLLTPGMDLYFAYHYSKALQFGVSVTSPYGGSLNYEDGWAGRFVVQDTMFYTININPTVAYRFNEQFALGAGAAVEYMNLQQTTALPLTPLVDGQINVKTENVAYGFNLGALYAPYPCTKMGIAYRSRVIHRLHGNLTFLRIPAVPNTSIKMVMPQNVIASFEQVIFNRLTLLAELGWSNWASMQNTILHIDSISVVTPLDWNNTYRAGFGGRVKVTNQLTLQTGVSYDSSPTTTKRRLPDLPMDRQIRAGVGVLYSMLKNVKLGFSYEYWNLGNANIYNVSKRGVLAGHYSRNFANTFQASIDVQV